MSSGSGPPGASSGGAAAITRAPQTELVDAVRHWVHFDNLAESLTKQVTNARSMRSQFEDKIMKLLEATGMQNATLQITGATLQRNTSFKPTDLSWTLLEKQLHEYYKLHRKPDETASVVEFIKKNRGGKTVECLEKKTLTADGGAKKPPST
jgi:hypothetical protein